jgi:hypothetical protein
MTKESNEDVRALPGHDHVVYYGRHSPQYALKSLDHPTGYNFFACLVTNTSHKENECTVEMIVTDKEITIKT